jgi:sugar-specific transcriptional regulator TrmB
MDKLQIVKILEELGLSENEARVYYASLQIGSASIAELAARSGVKRTTVYSVLDGLIEKELVTRSAHNFKNKIIPREPKELAHLLELKRRRLDGALPHLNAISQLPAQESILQYYRGMDKLRGIYSQMLELVQPGDDYLVLGNQEAWFRLSPQFFEDFLERRSVLPIKVRMILTPSSTALDRKVAQHKNEKIRLLPPDSKITTNLVVIPTRVFIHQLVEPVTGIVIDNPHVVTMHQEMFEHVWQGLS